MQFGKNNQKQYNMLKKTHLVQFCVAALAAATLFGACQKDNESVVEEPLLPGQIRLVPPASYTPAGSNGSKIVIDQPTSGAPSLNFANGDLILVNGEVCTVSNGRINFESEDPIYAIHPASLVAEGTDLSTNPSSVSITLPSEYTYKADATGKQILDIPMAAVAAAGSTELTFKHLASAASVRINNNTGEDMAIDKVSITLYHWSGEFADLDLGYPMLAGEATVNLTDIDNGLQDFVQPSTMTNSTVTMTIPNELLIVEGGEVGYVQIPINNFTTELEAGYGPDVFMIIKIEGHHKHDIASKYHWLYERGKVTGDSYAGFTLDRGEIMYFPVNAKTFYITDDEQLSSEINDNGGMPSSSISGSEYTPYFTVNSSGTKVRFAKGNLKYNVSTGDWAVMDNQYETLEVQGACYSSGSSDFDHDGVNGWMSLFVYGATGTHNYAPTTMGYSSTGVNTLSFFSGNEDWSTAGIGNGWRVLSSTEWEYILTHCKPTHNQVGGKKGVILYPDDYDNVYKNVYKEFGINTSYTGGKPNNGETIDNNVWAKMEAAGCIFLPVTGNIGDGNNTAHVENANGEMIEYWASDKKYIQLTFENIPNWNNNPLGNVISVTPSGADTKNRPIRLVQVVQ